MVLNPPDVTLTYATASRESSSATPLFDRSCDEFEARHSCCVDDGGLLKVAA
jgi:hypothetical protein